MVLTRLTAAEPYTSARLEVIIDLAPTDTVAALEAALTGLSPSPQTQLWIGERELVREATVFDAGIRDGVIVSVGGPSREPARGGLELRVISGPQAGRVHQLREGDTVVGGPGSAVVLDGLVGQRLLLQDGPFGLVASSLDPDEPVLRAGVPLLTAIGLDPRDQLEVGPHLLAVAPAPEVASGPVEVRRRERDRPDLGSRTLETPVPPMRPEPVRPALVPALVPLVLGLLLGFTVSRLFLLLALGSPLVIYGKRWLDQRAASAAFDQDVADYDQALADLTAEANRLMHAELIALREAFPDPVALLDQAAAAYAGVWERRPTDDDRLQLRVGTSSTNATSWRVGEQPPQLLHDVPVTVPVRRAGVVGVAGAPEAARALARWLVAQAAVLHSPDDLSIWLLAEPDADADAVEHGWDWLRWLPHSRGEPELCANLIGTTEESLTARIAELTSLVSERKALGTPAPDVLVVLDGDLTGRPEITRLLRDGPSLGVFALCVGAVPKQCRTTLTLGVEGRLTVTGAGSLPIREVRADLVSTDWAADLGRALAPLRPADPAPRPLPSSVSLLDLTPSVGVVERWQARLPIVVGAVAGGLLELPEGQHTLLAGSDETQTASLLRTVVASLALHRSPEALSLVLVGGVDDLAQLPHVSAVMGPPDGSESARALASLTAELRRRETLLASVNATDIEAFKAHGSLPRLVLVIAELCDVADFATGLARLLEGSGRLGVHLLAATSRPAEAPADVMAACSNRLVLRVEEAASSRRLLGSEAAAGVLPGAAGRGYARLGTAPVVPFLAAGVTNPRPKTRGALHAEDLSWSRLPLPLLPPGDEGSALPGLVKDLREADVTAAPSPWLPALPDRVVLDDLEAGTGAGVLPLGLEDLPAEQAQRPALWKLETGGNLLAVGAARSGRSTLLLTLAASLARTTSSSDVHVYGIDCGNGALGALSGLPHCGAVVRGDDPHRVDRLLTRLSAEVVRRRRQLAERGFSDLAAQRKGTADPLPYLLLLVDGWEGFASSLGRFADGRLVETLVELLREGTPAGLRVALTGDRSVLTSEAGSVLPDRLVLRLEDAEAYALAGLVPATLPDQVPVGRAFRARLGEALPAVDSVQIAVLAGDLATLAGELPPPRGRKPFRVDVLPAQVTWHEAQRLTPSGPGAGLAVGGDELRLQTVNLLTCGPGFTVAGPPRSGRSTALVVLARSLLEAGSQVCLITPATSPLAELRGAPGVLKAGDNAEDLAQALERVQGRATVLVDDADQLDDDQVAAWLQDVLRNGRARDHAVVVAGDTGTLSASSGGFAFDARRSRSGLLLSPASLDEGDLLGVRLQRSGVFSGPVGRGLLVRSGEVQLVQVPQPE